MSRPALPAVVFAVAFAVAVAASGCSGGALPLAGGAGGDGGVACEACGEGRCAALASADACEARADCHALFSGDLPCDSLGCANHFVECDDGARVSCTAPASPGGVDCTRMVGQCVAGDRETFLADGCGAGCVHAARCD